MKGFQAKLECFQFSLAVFVLHMVNPTISRVLETWGHWGFLFVGLFSLITS